MRTKEELLAKILKTDPKSAEGQLLLEELVQAAVKDGINEDEMRKHLLWMVKQRKTKR